MRRRAIAYVWVAVSIAVLYRTSFRPLPLDAPGTLRPVLYGWFTAYLKRFASAEDGEAWWNGICLGLLLAIPALALLNYWWASRPRGIVLRILCSRGLFLTTIGVALIASRFEILLNGPMNPDEAQFLAAAQKLFVDPVFFRSVDCGTTGPLNVYPLMLPSLVGFWPDYASGRAVALLLIFCSIVVLYRTFCLLLPDDQARIAVLPAAGAFTALSLSDFVHYTSEHVSFLITSCAVYLCVRILTGARQYAAYVFALGVLISAAIFAKMQTAPVVATIAMLALGWIHRVTKPARWWHPATMLAAGASSLTAMFLATCMATGVTAEFWMSYFVTNYRYAQTPALGVRHFLEFVMVQPDIQAITIAWLAITLIFGFARARSSNARMCGLAAGLTFGVATLVLQELTMTILLTLLAIAASGWLIVLIRQTRGAGTLSPHSWLGWLATAMWVAALFATYTPHRDFPHYLLLLVIPFCLMISWLMMVRFADTGQESRRGQLGYVLVFVTLVAIWQGSLLRLPRPADMEDIPATLRPVEGDFIRANTKDGDTIVVWGWNVGPYLGSGRPAGTRDLNMANFISPDERVRAFYRNRFLRDMQRSRPAMFIDATGPTSFVIFNDPKRNGFEAFPEIRSYIEQNYVEIADRFGQRFFAKRQSPNDARSTW